MTRVPKTKTRLTKRLRTGISFDAAPGSRLLAGGLCAVLAAMFVIHQAQVEGSNLAIRLLALAATAFFGALAWYFLRRGSRKGAVLHVGREGFGMALGFNGWVDIPWSDVEAFRYWEPTGFALLVKRRQSRWVGILLKKALPAAGRPAPALP